VALSDEQRAMLRLLAQREQGYDDIASLMGLSVGEVRAKVVGALAQLEAEGEPRPDVPPPFPVAGEEGAAAAKAPAKAPSEAAAEPKVEAPKDSPRPDPTPAPKAVPAEPVSSEKKPPAAEAKPKVEPAPKAAAAAPASGGSSGSGRTITIPSGRGLWPWIGGAVAIIVVVVVVILIAGGGGGGSSSTEAAATPPPAGEEKGTEETKTAEHGETAENASNPATSKQPTFAVLKAVGGGNASGKATFGRIKNKLALLVEAEGLETTGKNDAYTIWLGQSAKKMVPLASSLVEAKAKGKIAAQFEVQTEILAYLANGTFDQIYLTHTDDAKLKASVQRAVKKGVAPAYTGETVLEGTVTGPIVGAALREEEKQEATEKGE
jgi:hypothetical protein